VGPMMQWVRANSGLDMELPHMPQFTAEEQRLFKEQIVLREQHRRGAGGSGASQRAGDAAQRKTRQQKRKRKPKKRKRTRKQKKRARKQKKGTSR